MISILITAFNEPGIKKCIDSVIDQDIKAKWEIIVVAPDKKTEKIVKGYHKRNIKYMKDKGNGKVNAFNDVIGKIKGNIIVWTDGDLYLGKNSINELIKPFQNLKIGCVSGRPVPQDSRNNKYGFWAHLLYDAGAHAVRKFRAKKGIFLECSGYLFAFRNEIKKLPVDVAEDSVVPYLMFKKGYKIAYASKSFVYVKNPENLKDFIKQRSRTAGGHNRLKDYFPDFPKVKSFWNEVKFGTFRALVYPKNLNEFIWMVELAFVRLYIWFKVFLLSLNKEEYKDNWERVESTK